MRLMKKRFSRMWLIPAAACLFIFSALPAGATVIVHDAKQGIETAAQWVKEGKQWIKELQAYQDELLAKTGIRDVQGLIQDAKDISGDLQSIYDEGTAFIDDYISNPAGVLSPEANALLDKYSVAETCAKTGFRGDFLAGCKARFLSDLATVEYGEKLEKQLKKDNKNMKSLIDQVKSATDPKTTADAANAVALAQLKFEKTRFQYEMYRDKQAQLAAYKKEMVQGQFRDQQLHAPEPDYLKAWESLKHGMNE